MYQFTTPNLRIFMPEVMPVADMTSLVVTLKQGKLKIKKRLNEVVLDSVNNVIYVYLTQEETGAFNEGYIEVQCHIKAYGSALSTDKMTIQVCENIDGEVIV